MIEIASVVLENLVISNLEQNVQNSELNCLMRELKGFVKALDKPDEMTFRKVKASVERGERYAN